MIQFAASTHPGVKRDHNEDCFAADGSLNLWLVADGVGGHSHGEVASALVKATIQDAILNGVELLASIFMAHEAVVQELASHYTAKGMGSTVVAMTLKEKQFEIAWVGDSRAYLWDGEELRQLTRDHSYVQSLVARGTISSEQAQSHPERNVLTQSVGISTKMQIQPDCVRGTLKAGQQIILCSDGLNDELDDKVIAEKMREQNSVQGQVDGLINAALEAGGSDNVTVVIIGSPAPHGGPVADGKPGMGTTQRIGQAVLSQSEKRTNHNLKIWIICLISFALLAAVVFL